MSRLRRDCVGYLPMELYLLVKHVQYSTYLYCPRCLAIISPLTQSRLTITRCVPSRLPVAKSSRTFIFSCIPLFQPPKALSLAPHIFTVRAVTAETGQAGEQTGTRTDWIISGRTLMFAICAAQCMAAALKYWTSTALLRRFCGQSALQQMNRQGQGLLESAPTTWGSFEAEEGP